MEDTAAVATMLLAKVVEAAGGPPAGTADDRNKTKEQTPQGQKNHPPYNRTSKTGRAGDDSIGPDQFNQPRDHGPTGDVLDDADAPGDGDGGGSAD
jgi:hypothetical protein